MAVESIVRFIITGDSAGAVRAMRETEVAATKTTGALEKTGTAAKEADVAVAGIGAGVKRFRGLLGGVVGIAAAFGLKDAVQQGLRWQNQQAQLQVALGKTRNAAEGLKTINDAVDESAQHGGFAPSTELVGISQFVRLTHSATRAVELNTEAVDFARGAHIDYATAAQRVAQIQTGQVGRLQRYLGIIQPVTAAVSALTAAQKKQHPELLQSARLIDKQATAAKANALLLAKFGGAQKAFSNTAQGAIENAKNAFEILAQRLGLLLLPAVTKVAKAFTALAGWMLRNRDTMRVLGDILISVVAGFAAMKAAAGVVWLFEKLTVATGALAEGLAVARVAVWSLTAALLENPIALVIIAVAALVVGIVYAAKHFQSFRDTARGVLDWLKGAFMAVAHTVRAVFGFIANIVIGHVNFVIGAINRVIDAYNFVQKHIPFGLGAGKVGHLGMVKPVRFAAGGLVAGTGFGDSMPALLTPGEFVLRREVVDSVGVPALDRLNQGGGAPAHEPREIVIPVKLTTGGRVLAEEVARYSLAMAARR